ncbi:MAG: Antitoxin Phd YefM, type toxin-antitoxin system [Thermoanaerobaculia bacterium]|nr:Antitoxin Phd YefM, type toxin-antitoxin system [Thermoanaerobaculia bacterium]
MYNLRIVKTTTIREFRSNVAKLIDSDESVLVTKHGKPAAVLYPLRDPSKIPLEVRRKLFLALATDIGRQLDAKGVSDEEIDRDFAEFKKRRRR